MNKSYYAIIPADVRYDKRLTPNAKLLYGEITALCNEKGYCWASNSYFSELYGVSKVSISKWIAALETLGYIKIDMEYREGSKEISCRYITILKYPYLTKVNDPIKEKFNTPIKEKFKDNNTIYNNTFNNTINNNVQTEFETIWGMYPKKQGKKKAYKEYLKAIKDGVTNGEIKDGIQRYIQYIKSSGISDKYIKMGQTFFSGRCWDDEYKIESNKEIKNFDLMDFSELPEET